MLPENMTHEHKLLVTISAIVLSLLAIFLASKTWLAIREAQQVGKPVPYEYQISVEGIGEAKAIPDIAKLSYTVETRGPTTQESQTKNASVGNAILDGLVAQGVEKKDVKTTNYSSYQNYVYDDAGNATPGGDWTTSQSVEVTVRDLTKTSSLLTLLGQLGSTNIGGPNFAVENEETAKDEARILAIQDVKEKAQQIADSFGLTLKEVSSYSEYTDSPYYDYAKGGMGMSSPQAASPTVEPGEQTIKLHVVTSYTLQSSSR